MTLFGLAVLVLTAVGVYGVMAYSVNERRREIGSRMALGASRAAMLHAVMVRGVVLTAAGLAIGTPLALVLARLVSSLCEHLGCHDLFSSAIGAGCDRAGGQLRPALATRVDP